MLHLTPALVAALVNMLLCALLLGAVWTDVKSHRIPNRLVFIGAGLGVLLNGVLPEGTGFVSGLPGALGFWKASEGLALGLIVFLPMYMLRAMGAGDVKLMAMVGAFVGPNALIGTIILTFLIGGALSILTALRLGTLDRLIDNLRTMVMGSIFKAVLHEMPTLDSASVSAGKLPYGVAIAAGTFSYFAMIYSGHVGFLHVLSVF